MPINENPIREKFRISRDTEIEYCHVPKSIEIHKTIEIGEDEFVDVVFNQQHPQIFN